MKTNNIIANKSFAFAVRVVEAVKYMNTLHVEKNLVNQFLRSGTSIGANVAEMTDAQSTADFISKWSIALKEARETEYWILLLCATNNLTKTQWDSLQKDCIELIKLLTSILKTSRMK